MKERNLNKSVMYILFLMLPVFPFLLAGPQSQAPAPVFCEARQSELQWHVHQ